MGPLINGIACAKHRGVLQTLGARSAHPRRVFWMRLNSHHAHKTPASPPQIRSGEGCPRGAPELKSSNFKVLHPVHPLRVAGLRSYFAHTFYPRVLSILRVWAQYLNSRFALGGNPRLYNSCKNLNLGFWGPGNLNLGSHGVLHPNLPDISCKLFTIN